MTEKKITIPKESGQKKVKVETEKVNKLLKTSQQTTSMNQTI